MVKCPTCAAEQADASKFCSECGAALNPQFTATLTHAVDPNNAEGQAFPPSDSSLHGRFLPGKTFAGRYRIVSLVGKGGMGEVYRADDLKLGHTVALKFLPCEVADDARRLEYFHSEVRLTRQISHANVCRVHDIGEADGQHFLSMEYIDGEDLGTLLRRIGRLPQDKGVQIARQLCAGLAAAHEQGVLHRDLKPANIMLDGRGQVRITDFGLARLAEEVVDGEVAGTPAYMSPEQFARGASTIQSDLYALGLVLYEVFTGEAAHKAETPAKLQKLRQETTPVPPSSQVDDLDPFVERVILQCLEKEPHDRPPSALAVASALPGGDPLAAAMAAGETPSPELVAAAGETGGLSYRAGVLMLVGVALSLLLNAWLADQTSVLKKSSQPNKPAHPIALTTRAKEAVRQLDYDYVPADHSHGFMTDGRTATYWYRQRRQATLVVHSFWLNDHDPNLTSRARPTFYRPPMRFPGEVALQLTPDGRLRTFRARPEATENASPPTPADFPWDTYFNPELTGYQLLSKGGEAPSEVVAPVAYRISDEKAVRFARPPDAFDALAVWRVEPNHGPSFFIQAAAFRGKPVFFAVLPQPSSEETSTKNAEPQNAVNFRRVWSDKDFFVLIATAVFVWWNLRTGRCDRRGALRLTQFFFWVAAATWLLQTRHLVFAGHEIEVITLGLAQVLFGAAMVWMAYIGFEPLIRRLWPELLISAMRLIRGRYRDPLVGRDLLAGVLAGLLIALLHRVNMIVHQHERFAGHFNHEFYFNNFALLGAWELIGCILDAIAFAMTVGWELVVLIVLVRLVVRFQSIAVVAVIALYTYLISEATGSDFRVSWLTIGAFMTLNMLVIVRLGFLSWVAVLAVYFLACTLPVITLDRQAWYAGHGLLVNAAIAAIAIYGFVVSQGGWRAHGHNLRLQ